MTYTAQGHTKTETNSQSERTYGYNAAERLTNFTSTLAGQANAQIEANYRYDPFGRRISKAVKEGATTKATYFLYSDTGLMGEANEQGQLTKAYGFNPVKAQQGLWSTDPVWQAEASGGSLTAQSSSFHYLHTDHLGTPMLATDKLGSTSWTAVAEAFGATGVLQSSSIAMNLRFPGQYWDGETGNHYNFHRDYKAGMGRYLEGDPAGLVGGINKYVYSLGNAISAIDDRGLVSWSGNVTSGGAVNVVGAIGMRFSLTSECACNKKIKIEGYASFLAAGFGPKLSGSGGSSAFYDNYACPDAASANGLAAGAAVSWVTGGGASLSATALGHLRSTWPPVSTGLGGWDTSASVYMGWSVVTSAEEEVCKCQ